VQNYSAVLFDPAAVRFVPKSVISVSEQDEFESRKLWLNVTSALKKLDHAEATVERRKLHAWAKQQMHHHDGVETSPPNSPSSDADSSLSGSKHDALPRYFQTHEGEYVIKKERIGTSPGRTESQ
jgi:hypothetical protein